MSICVGGCARNCAAWLPSVISNIRLLCSYLEVVMVYISYDESADATYEILRSIDNLPLKILTGHNEGICRQHCLSIARNRILEAIEADKPAIDYLIMMDMDDVCSGRMDISVISEALARESEWDALSFNREPYYDYWALSLGDFQFSIWHHKYPRALLVHLRAALADSLNSTDDMIDVDSAFGGFAIYKWSVFQRYRYESLIDLRLFDATKIARIVKTHKSPIMPRIFHDCEHRAFHLRARQDGARIRIFAKSLFHSLVS